ncbi:RusA family crossover junction endodeoxyribonuclease [Prescottella equi]|uniref:hypothetical protein n=1 Tax=Rhodococcus hoagii TaxID=43767 RepID=UPI0007CD5DD5|nr:hypothetical protein [Prescottella equi]
MTAYLLTIIDERHPGRPPLTMNEWRNCHWRKKVTAKKRIDWQILQASREAGILVTIPRAKVTITQHAPDGRRRDADGLSAFRKDVLDALVAQRILPDDNHKHVIDGGNHIAIDRTNPRMEILLEEVA